MSAPVIDWLSTLTDAQKAQLYALSVPKIVPEFMRHIPHPKQQLFLGLQQKEVMYGGSAGGGKSDALLMAALQYVDVPGYSALILRRTWPDLNAAGAILDRMRVWMEGTSARAHDGGRYWTFPSGARVSFGYMLHENDKLKFQSAEYQFVGFDELTHFPETMYEYLFSRLRRPSLHCLNCGTPVRNYPRHGWRHVQKPARKCPMLFPDPAVMKQYRSNTEGLSAWSIPLRVRSATNPGGIGHEWVYNRFINPKTKHAGSVFIPASLRDNPSLDQKSYEESLSHLGAIERARLMDGDWNAYEEGGMFKRAWFDVVDQPLRDYRVERVRAWDMAGSEGEGDWTVGALVAMLDGEYWIEDIVRGQWEGATLERIVAQTAHSDGRDIAIRMEQEGGSAGKSLISHYMRNVVNGFNFDGERPTGSKVIRAKPWAVLAENNHVRLISAQWNKTFLDEAETFPLGAHDDIIDAVSLGVNYLSDRRMAKILV